jgi:hypothetical protein
MTEHPYPVISRHHHPGQHFNSKLACSAAQVSTTLLWRTWLVGKPLSTADALIKPLVSGRSGSLRIDTYLRQHTQKILVILAAGDDGLSPFLSRSPLDPLVIVISYEQTITYQAAARTLSPAWESRCQI